MKKDAKKQNACSRTPALSKKQRGAFMLALLMSICLLTVFFIKPDAAGTDDVTGRLLSNTDFPLLYCDDPIYYQATDNVISACDKAAAACFSNLRQRYGASEATQQDVLNKLSLYASMSALCGGISGTSDDPSGRQNGAEQAVNAVFERSGIKGDATFVYYTDYTCTDGQRSAELALNSILNSENGSKLITSRSAVKFGLASAIRSTGSGCEYCFVLVTCYAGTDPETISGLAEKIPEIMCMSGELESAHDQSELSGEIYVEKGHDTTGAAISEACGIRDLRGTPASVKFREEDIDTAVSGTRSVNVSVTLGGRIAGGTIGVNVAGGKLEFDSVEDIVLPPIPEGEIWDLAAYASKVVKDPDFQAQVICSPAFIGGDAFSADTEVPAEDGSGEETAVQSLSVKVMVKGSDGNVIYGDFVLSCGSGEYEPVRPLYTDNKGLNVTVEKDNTLSEGGHSVITWTDQPLGETAEQIYLFTTEAVDGSRKTVRKQVPYVVWVPGGAGTVTVDAMCIDGAGNSSGASIIISVAKLAEIIYVEPELSLTGSLSVTDIDGGTKLVYGIRAGTQAADVISLFNLTGGQEPEIKIFKADGTPIEGSSVPGTGAVIKLIDGDKVFEELTIIIAGDSNGDGAVGIADFAKLRQQLLKDGTITGVFVYAADLNGDGSLGIADFAKLRQYLLGNIDLN